VVVMMAFLSSANSDAELHHDSVVVWVEFMGFCFLNRVFFRCFSVVLGVGCLLWGVDFAPS